MILCYTHKFIIDYIGMDNVNHDTAAHWREGMKITTEKRESLQIFLLQKKILLHCVFSNRFLIKVGRPLHEHFILVLILYPFKNHSFSHSRRVKTAVDMQDET